MFDLRQLVRDNRAGKPIALASVCSAHPDVLIASLFLAKQYNRTILIEATSNQVNQFGGYTGMTPVDFISFVKDLAKKYNVDEALIQFGGDHLGPQVWRRQSADIAMENARHLMRSYVEAGFTKIHLDCSEGCAGEAAQVDDETSAERAAELAMVCERYTPHKEQLSYVIGTEVPPPGGARLEDMHHVEDKDFSIQPTSPDRAHYTLACHRKAFHDKGLDDVWDRVIGLVVQPGLEFGPLNIDRFDITQPDHLSTALDGEPHIGFEAHSTDYQYDAVFPELAQRHFPILKVGPALTFAYRQAIYALDHIRGHLCANHDGQSVMSCMERLMLAEPNSWQHHYNGSEESIHLQRHFSYADRIRYYWAKNEAQDEIKALMADLANVPYTPPLIVQYFSPAVIERALHLEQFQDKWIPVLCPGLRKNKSQEPGFGSIKTGKAQEHSQSSSSWFWAEALVHAQIQTALVPYFFGLSD